MKFTSDDSIAAVFTAYASTTNFEIDNFAEAGIPYILGGNSAQTQEIVAKNPSAYPLTWSLAPSYDGYNTDLPTRLEEWSAAGTFTPRNRLAYIVSRDNPYRTGIAAGLTENLKAKGWEVSGPDVVPFGEIDDWNAQLGKIRQADPSLIINLDYQVANAAKFMTQFRQNPTDSLVFIQYAPSVPEFLDLAGKDAEGLLYNLAITPLPGAKESDTIFTAYKKKYNEEAGLSAAAVYEGIRLWAQAAEQVGDPSAREKVGKAFGTGRCPQAHHPRGHSTGNIPGPVMGEAVTQPLLEVRDVARHFGGFRAVDGVSFTVEQGEILGIAGPNGAGKSTLFNLITGTPFGPSAGTVRFDGTDITGKRPHRIARLGLRRTFQAEQLFGTLSVEDNVRVAAGHLGSGAGRVGDDVNRALDRVDLSGVRTELSADLPLYEKKRLMIATALVGQPKLLMLDEPAGGLNTEDQESLVQLLAALRGEGLTLIIIEHVLSLLRQLAGRMLVMAVGQVLVEGDPAEVLNSPEVLEAYLGEPVAVVNSASLSVTGGTSVAVFGPNGHGKTTLLRAITGLGTVSSGTVRFRGENITGMPAHQIAKTGLVHVPQGSMLFPKLSVTENLMLGGRSARARGNRDAVLVRVQELFPKLGERRNQLVGTLSGGERQMVAIGMGLMASPELLILDEPSLGLAPKVRHEIAETLRQIRSTGLTLLITDGDIDFLFNLSDEWKFFEEGRITASGSAANRPSHEEIMAICCAGLAVRAACERSFAHLVDAWRVQPKRARAVLSRAYTVWTLSVQLELPVIVAMLITLPVLAAVGLLIELVAVRPLLRRPNGTLLVMVSTLGIASALEGAIQLVWGPQNKQVPSLVAGACLCADRRSSAALPPRTGMGWSILAVEQNREMARLVGISPARVYASVFAIAAVLAGAAAVVYSTSVSITPTKGSGPLLTAFVVLVFGGTASLWGTVLGAFAIGTLEATTTYFFGLQWSPILVFLVLVVVMLFLRGPLGLLVCGIVVVALPYVVTGGNDRTLLVTALLYALLATSWNLTLGYGGIFNFAHVAFFGLGGYGMAVATVKYQLNPWFGLGIAGVVGAIAGLITYLPVIRMRGIYVALITFVFVQLSSLTVLALPDLTGGSLGIVGVPSLEIGGVKLRDAAGAAFIWLLGALLVALIFGMRVLLRSRFGLSIVALRDNEALAESRGVNRVVRQAQAFALSGALAGVTGGLYVSFFRVADTSMFGFGFITLSLSMIFVGGMSVVWGPALGAALITLLDRQLLELGSLRQVIIGLGTVAALILLRAGVSGWIVALWKRATAGIRARRTRDPSPESATASKN
ncbi:hypothetical protein FQR65_LT20295 [Abscondita terminalis]|nr:hypothetical protein FQR65_LT20295 [Abscondita terminalis]